jgi:malonate-semialdehyde dehydrogenase (acetylating)/methylmalonate-semialdehyde dehydrogenase
MTRQISHYVGSRLVQGGGNRSASVYNPATGEVSAQVALASAEQVRDAVLNAKAAAPRWASTTPLRRARILSRFLHILEERLDTLAEVISARARQNHFRCEGRSTARDGGR